MSRHLPKRHPLERTYDELQRAIRRVDSYIDSHGHELKEIQVAQCKSIIESVKYAIDLIPEQYRRTKHAFEKENEGENYARFSYRKSTD